MNQNSQQSFSSESPLRSSIHEPSLRQGGDHLLILSSSQEISGILDQGSLISSGSILFWIEGDH